MNNERYNQIIDEVYENYLGNGDIKWLKPREYDTPMGKINVPTPYSKEELVEKCKTDSEFSEKWGLKIEEREWSVKERLFFVNKSNEEYEKALANKTQYESIGLDFELALTSRMNELNIPTKLITVTYKDEKIEVYE